MMLMWNHANMEMAVPCSGRPFPKQDEAVTCSGQAFPKEEPMGRGWFGLYS